jgi:hypothetical protein
MLGQELAQAIAQRRRKTQRGTALVAALAADPDIELDLTPLDFGRLPAEVKASLYSRAVIFDAQHLQHAANVHAPHATRFSAPELRTAGNITATHTHTFESPCSLTVTSV